MVQRYTSDKVDVSPLAQPLKFEFSNRTAPNRFLKAAMTERLSSWSATDFSERGVPSSNLINVYRRWGEGGFGVILTGNVMVEYDQLEAAGNPIIPPGAPHDDKRFQAFAEMAKVSKAHGALIVAQVSHPGRQCEERIQKDPVSASDVQLEGNVMGMSFAKPHAASKAEIQHIVQRFTDAAVYLHKAGYDGIELHGAHGYLLAQFLSQTTNKRTDEYGGSLENRARIITEMARSIRDALPAASTGFVLGIKVNSVEFQTGGFSTEEATELVQLLERNEFDFVELSGGTYESLAFKHKRESSKKREGFFLDFADKIAPALHKTKSYVTGGLKTAGAMVQAVQPATNDNKNNNNNKNHNTGVDGVGLARPVCQEFHLPRDILSGKVDAAIQQDLDQDDFGLTNVAAGTQIRQVGKDQDPIDLSDPANVQVFRDGMGEWGQKMQRDAAHMNLYGYVDLPDGPAYRS